MNDGFGEERDLSRIPSEVTTRVLKLDIRQQRYSSEPKKYWGGNSSFLSGWTQNPA